MLFGMEGVDPARRCGRLPSAMQPRPAARMPTCVACRAELIQLLDIDVYQRLNTMSDGQRRRVQICMGLLKPYDVRGPGP